MRNNNLNMQLGNAGVSYMGKEKMYSNEFSVLEYPYLQIAFMIALRRYMYL